ncbi:MAG: Veg family protein [Clostridia bacterium]|nr:Veg family protein [Clostridia bacterium]
MRKNLLNLIDIKNRISNIKGKNIDISINRGRKKIDNYYGIIENIYPSVFTVKILNDQQLKNVTCSYSDVLCGDVKIVEK